MADKNDEESCCCSSCFDLTKYTCLGCDVPICNICSVFEEDEETKGWRAGKSVGRCQSCLLGINSDSPGDREKNINVKQAHADGDTSDSEPKKKRTKGEASENLKVKKKKAGRKTRWSSEALDDFIDIVVSDEYYQKKLIFTNTKSQQNVLIYQKILTELKARCSGRNEEMNFTASQVHTKFKKCVSDCKYAALTIKTGAGIKQFQDERGFGAWFNNLYALVKTRDSCNPEQAVEPSAITKATDESDVDEDLNESENFFVPVRSAKKKSLKQDTVVEAIDLIRETITNDPTKELIAFMCEELQKSREHKTILVNLMLSTNNSPSQQQSYAASNMPQYGFGRSVPSQQACNRLPLNFHHQMYSQAMSSPQALQLHTTHQGYGSYGGLPNNVGINMLKPVQVESFRPASPVTRPLSSCPSSSATSMSSSGEQHLDANNFHRL